MDALRKYQKDGVKWLKEKPHRLLGDDPGLGKSAQCVTATDDLNAYPVLIVCPAIARITWVREFEKFSFNPPKWDVMLSTMDAVTHTPGRSIVSSFEIAAQYADRWTARTKFKLLIIDEVHFLKSVEAKRAKAILGKNGLTHKIPRTWALSGTPADNHVGELWILLYTFGITRMTYEDFIHRYCNYYRTGPYSKIRITDTKPNMIPEVREMLSHIMLRRKKEEVLTELPPIQYGDVVVEPCEVPVNVAIKNQIQKEYSAIESALDGMADMAALEALAESVSTLRRYIGLQKVDGAIEIVRTELELEQYEKIVIFAVHTDVIERLEKGLSKFGVCVLNGSTPAHQRQAVIDKFQSTKLAKVFIGNIRACGTNITLTASDQVLMVEREWVPSWNNQAIQRTHRLGQNRRVTCRTVLLPNPLDEKITAILEKKERQLSQIFD